MGSWNPLWQSTHEIQKTNVHWAGHFSPLYVLFPSYTVAAALDLNMEAFHNDISESKRTGVPLHGFILWDQKIMDVNIRSTITVKDSLPRK